MTTQPPQPPKPSLRIIERPKLPSSTGHVLLGLGVLLGAVFYFVGWADGGDGAFLRTSDAPVLSALAALIVVQLMVVWQLQALRAELRDRR